MKTNMAEWPKPFHYGQGGQKTGVICSKFQWGVVQKPLGIAFLPQMRSCFSSSCLGCLEGCGRKNAQTHLWMECVFCKRPSWQLWLPKGGSISWKNSVCRLRPQRPYGWAHFCRVLDLGAHWETCHLREGNGLGSSLGVKVFLAHGA